MQGRIDIRPIMNKIQDYIIALAGMVALCFCQNP